MSTDYIDKWQFRPWAVYHNTCMMQKTLRGHCNIGDKSSVGDSVTTNVTKTVGVGKHNGEKGWYWSWKYLTLMSISIIFAEEGNVFVKTKLIGFKINNELQFCYVSVHSIFVIAHQDANFEIVNVVIICIEMHWQRKKLFLSDRVCVIIKSISEMSAWFSNILWFWPFWQSIKCTTSEL